MSQSNQSQLDNEPFLSFVQKLILEEGATNATVVRELAEEFGVIVSESAVRRFRKRHGLQIPGVKRSYTKISGDTAEGLTEPKEGRILDDPDTMLRERGLDPLEWYIDPVLVNEWQGPAKKGFDGEPDENGNPTGKVTYHQAKFTARRRHPVSIVAPRTEGWKRPPRRYQPRRTQRLIVVVGDQQAPFHDRLLHSFFLEWLQANRPDQGISLGDSVDFPDISRHQLDPENSATVNECLQTGYDMFRGYVDASPETEWTKLIGNHDERIRNLLLDKPKNIGLYGIKRPDTLESEGERVHELSHLMRLDELGIKVIDPEGKYDLAQIKVSDKLAVMHGWIAQKGSGKSALATLEHLGYSVIVGHTHRQSVVHQTKHDINGYPETVTGVEAGCMCRVSQAKIDGRIWPNYAVKPDWQQGFATVEVWDDGKFKIDTATYVNNTLMWRDERYS